MPIYRGTKNQTLFLGPGKADGTSNVRVYLGDKLVYAPFRPPEGDLLLAGPRVYLKAGAEVYLDYKNQPLLRQDTLSNRNVGTGAFDVSFTFTPDKTASYRELLHVPGLVKFWYSWQSGYGLVIEVPGLGARAISTEDITAKSVPVRFWKATADDNIVLQVGDTSYTLAKSWVPWEHAQITAYNTVGKITSYNSNAGAQDTGSLTNTQYPGFGAYYFQNKQAMIEANLSPSPWSYYWQPLVTSNDTDETFIKWELPSICRIKGFSVYYNPPSSGSAEMSLYTSQDKMRQIGLTHNTKDGEQSDIPISNSTYPYLKQNIQELSAPINTNELYYVLKGTSSNWYTIYGLWIIPVLEKYNAPSFNIGQLQLYSTKELSNLILA